MSKKVFALLLVACVLTTVFAGCKPSNKITASSGITSSENTSLEQEKEENSSKKPSESSTVSTNSLTVSISRPDDTASNEDESDEWGDWDDFEETSSQTVSSGIKEYDQRLNIGIYHLSMYWCDHYGTDFDDRADEFREVVEGGYFNTYFLSAQSAQKKYLEKEMEIIAKNYGTFWITVGLFHSSSTTIEKHEESFKKIIDMITEAGYRDRLLGVTWDEPINIRGQANRDYLAQSELYYKKFGLRTFPVFAVDGFVGANGDINKFPGEKGQKIATEALKYTTDVGFDVYSVDVRDGASNGGQYANWTRQFGKTVTNGKEYYIALKELLKERADHKVNVWYFPTAFEWKTWDGKADEAFCLAQLEFMAEDILKDEYGGGLALYTYYRHTTTHNTIALGQRIDLAYDSGDYKRYPEYDKWLDYCKRLREICQKFNATKANLTDLGL